MNIEDLTIKEVRELQSLFVTPKLENRIHSDMIKKYCVFRTKNAGVHVGYLQDYQEKHARITESRRIWSWNGALSLSEVSQNGITGGKVAVEIPEIILTEVIEIIPCTSIAAKCLKEFPVTKQ